MKKLIIHKEIEDIRWVFYGNLDSVIQCLIDLKSKYSNQYTNLTVDIWQEGISLYGNMEETDIAYKKRLAKKKKQNKAEKERKEERDRREYERLQKKFGDK